MNVGTNIEDLDFLRLAHRRKTYVVRVYGSQGGYEDVQVTGASPAAAKEICLRHEGVSHAMVLKELYSDELSLAFGMRT